MRYPILKTVAGLLTAFLVIGLAIFLPAWSFMYWQAWVFLAVSGCCVLAISLYLMQRDPGQLERPIRIGPVEEHVSGQRFSRSIAVAAFLLLFVVPSVDHRFACSEMHALLVFAGDALVALGLLAVFLVLRENSAVSERMGSSDERSVISSGPYAIVRHPMYAGALVMLCGVPLALASWFGVPFVFPMVLVIVWRLDDEERFLHRALPGYPEYCATVRYRLLPGVW